MVGGAARAVRAVSSIRSDKSDDHSEADGGGAAIMLARGGSIMRVTYVHGEPWDPTEAHTDYGGGTQVGLVMMLRLKTRSSSPRAAAAAAAATEARDGARPCQCQPMNASVRCRRRRGSDGLCT
jgi:hypothetical protein